ncbi:hypothetical protein [Microvirga aerophila]|uniref:Pentapeptide repeat-containing protein n=1 Tax=Microvirga aerophila TaxID=670291 RepID=A0A512BNE1_9HYPH|nr:hypothetical protein [Microvirga aerophila]GEO13470.1 hypothetical protein MAE02_11660 [Microvirga aerophila]
MSTWSSKAFLAAVIGLSTVAGANALEVANGLSANGLSANGLSANGLSANGLSANGLSANGLSANGLSANGNSSVAAQVEAVILHDGSRISIR